ncbi:MAG: DUF4175 domain-containing protein [Alphaproteobacteria bacterium]
MIEPLDTRFRPFFLFLERKRRGAYFVLTLENIALCTWRPIFWCLFFAGLWMLAIPEFLGTAISILTVLVFLSGLVYLIRKDTLNFNFPDAKNIDKRLEQFSKLGQGHIALIEDRLANPAIINTRTLWQKAQRDGLFRLKKLRIPMIRLPLSKQDPHALRFIALLVFFSGALVAGHDWNERIINGIMPISPTLPAFSQERSVDLWIMPPDYTQMPQIHLSGSGYYNKTLQIPEESTFRLRIRTKLTKWIRPHLHMGKKNIPLTDMEGGLYGTEGEISPGNNMKLTQALFPRAKWPYNYIIDTPPQIQSDVTTNQKEDNKQKPSATPEALYETLDNAQLRFPLIVKDDYGVKELHMTMQLDDMIEDKPLGQSISETRLIMSQPGDDFKIAPIYDIAWHSWAGLPVTFEFTVFDHKKQQATLEKIKAILPERDFKHPVAKSIIAARKKLAWNYKGSFKDIALELEELLSRPFDFQNDITVFLALRTASSRLYHQNNKPQEERKKTAKEVISLLWTTALAIEEGDVAIALRELRAAQKALENAMRAPDATDKEIQDLMENLRHKMRDYFTELQREAQKRMAQGEDMPSLSPQDFGMMITPDSLAQMMAQIEQAMRNGDEQKAQQLMSNLQRMMEMIDPSKGAQLPRDMQMMQQGINELQKLIERQEDLIKQTEDQAVKQHSQSYRNEESFPTQNITPRDLPALEQMLRDFGMETIPPPPSNDQKKPSNYETKEQIDTSQNKTEQDALRYILGQLMMDVAEETRDIPEKMGMAEQEMRHSADKLAQNDPAQSLPHQSNAVQYLKDSQENLAEQFRQRAQQMIGIGMGTAGQQYDPLGRPYNNDENGMSTNSNIKVPDEAQKKRVDEIIRQLHQRSGDRSRSREELEYYRRLLRQF